MPKNVSAAMDQRDAARVAEDNLNLTRCVGGRIQREGFTCSHCASMDPGTYCAWAHIGGDSAEGRRHE